MMELDIAVWLESCLEHMQTLNGQEYSSSTSDILSHIKRVITTLHITTLRKCKLLRHMDIVIKYQVSLSPFQDLLCLHHHIWKLHISEKVDNRNTYNCLFDMSSSVREATLIMTVRANKSLLVGAATWGNVIYQSYIDKNTAQCVFSSMYPRKHIRE